MAIELLPNLTSNIKFINEMFSTFTSELSVSFIRAASGAFANQLLFDKYLTIIGEADGIHLPAIISSCKLLRTPDSLRGTGYLIMAFRYLILYYSRNDVKFGAYNDNTNSTSASSASSTSDWRWLIRFTYDRRGAIRLLALELMNILLTSNINMSTEGETPIHSMIHRLLLDTSESTAVRLKAATIYFRHFVVDLESNNDNAADDYDEDKRCEIGQAVRSLLEGLDAKSSTCCLSTIAGISRILSELLIKFSQSQAKSEVIIEILKAYRCIPALVSLLNPDTSFKLIEATLLRLNRSPSSSLDNHQNEPALYGLETCSKYLIPEIEAEFSDLKTKENLMNGWRNLWGKYQLKLYSSLQESRSFVLRIIHSIGSIDFSLFNDCIR